MLRTMTVLRERQTWKREPRARADRFDTLSPEQRANVRKSMDLLRVKHRDWKGVARAMGVKPVTLLRALKGPGKPRAGLALRAAQLAGVPVEDVLSGAYAAGWVCPTCGRGGE